MAYKQPQPQVHFVGIHVKCYVSCCQLASVPGLFFLIELVGGRARDNSAGNEASCQHVDIVHCQVPPYCVGIHVKCAMLSTC